MNTGDTVLATDLAQGLSIENLSFAFPGASGLFSNFSMQISLGTTAILGGSGVGKSTLLRLISGRLTPRGGTIRRPQRQRLAWMGQSGALMPWANVEENVVLGARLRGERPDLQHARDLLGRVGLTGCEKMWPSALSGGMQQRVALARTLMEAAHVVLLDEPFAHLDAVTKAKLYALAAHELRGRIAVMVTHDPLEALTLADRVVVLAGAPVRIAANVVLDGAAPRDARDPALDRVYRNILTALEAT
jgi:putative hydroxymethylpyrimidine transport system ATP-binding protein